MGDESSALMAYYGADPGQLRALAAQFSKGAALLESHAQSLHSMIGSATSWQGPDAERFRSQWAGRDFKAMSAAITMLRASAQDLKRNADEQEGVSGGSGGSAGDARSGASTGASGLFAHIENSDKTDDANRDGMRIERVVGPDGETRLIVYLKGTGATDRDLVQDWVRNAGLVGGDSDDVIRSRIEAALDDTPKGRSTDVMLVGFSQGGMLAQNIAASGDYSVTDLVTYGAPITHSDIEGVQAAHLQANSDPVPGGGGFLGGSHTSDHVFNSNADTPWGEIAHSDAAYANVASDFDNSNDPRFADVKDSMKKYQGVVVDTYE